MLPENQNNTPSINHPENTGEDTGKDTRNSFDGAHQGKPARGNSRLLMLIGALLIVAAGAGWYFLQYQNPKPLNIYSSMPQVGGNWPEYYKVLAQNECQGLEELAFDGCIESVGIAAEYGLKIRSESGCPEGFKSTKLRLVGALIFCTPDPTANWQTYRNERYKFEIKYPPDWIMSEVDGSLLLNSGEILFGENISKGYFDITIVLDFSIAESDIKEVENEMMIEIRKNQTTEILGTPAVLSADINSDTSYRKTLEFVYRDYYIQIDRRWGIAKKVNIEDFTEHYKKERLDMLKLQNQILSTFKFIP